MFFQREHEVKRSFLDRRRYVTDICQRPLPRATTDCSGSAATRRAEEEQSFDRARTIFPAGQRASASCRLHGHRLCRSTAVSAHWWRRRIRASMTARCPRPEYEGWRPPATTAAERSIAQQPPPSTTGPSMVSRRRLALSRSPAAAPRQGRSHRHHAGTTRRSGRVARAPEKPHSRCSRPWESRG